MNWANSRIAIASFVLLLFALSTLPFLTPAYSDGNVNFPVSITFKAFESNGPAFDPDPLHVKIGDTVTWTNHDVVPHFVVEGSPSSPSGVPEFESPLLAPMQSYSHTFNQTGTYPYYDQVHPFLTGTVIVGDERSPLPAVTVETDKVYYNAGETVNISGKVANVTATDLPVIIQVFNPNGAAYRFDQVVPSSADGSFKYSLEISGILGVPGDYTIKASYGTYSTQTGFRLLAQLSSLTVNSISSDGSSLNMWTTIEFLTLEGNRHFIVGYTPNSFELPQQTVYTVSVQDYLDSKFAHWEDGSTNRTRTFTLSANTTITAFYTSGLSERGFTPLKYVDSEGLGHHDLTVQAYSIGDNQILHMWTRIENLGVNSSGDSFKVTVHDYSNRLFDHWQDGVTDRTRTFTINEDTTVRAYYRTT